MQCFDKIPPVGENQRWLPAAIFVDRSESFSGERNKTTRGTSQTS